MYVDDHCVGTGGDGGAGQRDDEVAPAARVRRVDDDRQVRKLVHDRYRADVERVAGRGLEGTDAALAQDDVEVAALRDVLRGHQPLFDGRVHAALEHDRFAGGSDRL